MCTSKVLSNCATSGAAQILYVETIHSISQGHSTIARVEKSQLRDKLAVTIYIIHLVDRLIPNISCLTFGAVAIVATPATENTHNCKCTY